MRTSLFNMTIDLLSCSRQHIELKITVINNTPRDYWIDNSVFFKHGISLGSGVEILGPSHIPCIPNPLQYSDNSRSLIESGHSGSGISSVTRYCNFKHVHAGHYVLTIHKAVALYDTVASPVVGMVPLIAELNFTLTEENHVRLSDALSGQNSDALSGQNSLEIPL